MDATIPLPQCAPREPKAYSLNLRMRRGVQLLTDAATCGAMFGDLLAGTLAIITGMITPLGAGLPAAALSLGKVTPAIFGRSALFGAFLLLCCLFYARVYSRAIILNLHELCSRILRACALWFVLEMGAVFLLKVDALPNPGQVLFTAVLLPTLVLCWRWVLQAVLSRTGLESRLRQRVLFLGWTPESGRMARNIWQSETEACEVVGYIDLPADAIQHSPPGNVPYLGTYDDLGTVLQQELVNAVILTDVNIPRNAILEIATACEKELVDFKIIPSYFPILVSAMQVKLLSGVPLLGVDKLPLNSLSNRLLKRSMDIIGGLIGLFVAGPIIAIFGILIYLESPGPIFFRQERIGRRGLRFDMFKLRSMRPDAAKQDHLAQSTRRGDPRLLRVGAFMRRWNIDELPQFWNVLAGDMSIVGPRPERTFHSEVLKDQIPHYNARYISKPGLTGWAQIHGLRGDTDLTERIQHDIYYMEHWTPFLDAQIAFRTIFSYKNAC